MFPLDFSDNSILLSGVEIGTHYYWDIGDISVKFRKLFKRHMKTFRNAPRMSPSVPKLS